MENDTAENSNVEEHEESDKEIALQNILNEVRAELEDLKVQLKEARIRNEEMAIRLGADSNKKNFNELLQKFSKYYKGE